VHLASIHVLGASAESVLVVAGVERVQPPLINVVPRVDTGQEVSNKRRAIGNDIIHGDLKAGKGSLEESRVVQKKKKRYTYHFSEARHYFPMA
jgi:hypothetical protein